MPSYDERRISVGVPGHHAALPETDGRACYVDGMGLYYEPNNHPVPGQLSMVNLRRVEQIVRLERMMVLHLASGGTLKLAVPSLRSGKPETSHVCHKAQIALSAYQSETLGC